MLSANSYMFRHQGEHLKYVLDLMVICCY